MCMNCMCELVVCVDLIDSLCLLVGKDSRLLIKGVLVDRIDGQTA